MPSLTRVRLVVFKNIIGRPQPCRHIRKLQSSAAPDQSIFNDIYQRSSQGPLVFHSTTQNPFENLALEHYLLTQSHPASRILIFYTNRPSVIIGRNQNPWSECNLLLLEKGLQGHSIDLVRRRSGGGTVFHDAGNLNFSVIVPNDAEFNRRKHAEMVARAIKSASFWKGAQAFDDVWVNERHDIVMKRQDKVFKVSGSAFKLTRGRALHHGTLLHSSPNLGAISDILRSPAASNIQAKGVESVRSPVSNLYNIPDIQRDGLRSAITNLVVQQFSKLYGHGSEYSMGETETRHPKIQDGLMELRSNEWTFGQTPRFEFTSPSIEDQQIYMSVNHGVIEASSVDVLKGNNIWETSSWSVTKVPALDDFLTRSFPAIASTGSRVNSFHDTLTDQREQKVIRRLEDGSVEVELEPNTVEIRATT